MKLPKDFPKHQTVEWLIDILKSYNPKAQLVFATSYGGDPLCLLSVYPGDDKSDEKTKQLLIDIGWESD